MKQNQAVFRLASILLQYPSEEWWEYMKDLKEEVNLIESDLIKKPLLKFLSFIEGTTYSELCHQYVSTFDFHERTTLYLTYSVFQDNRERGAALVKLRQQFQAAEVELESDELPDYLPLILEFVSITDPKKSIPILRLHARSMERLNLELEAMNSPYHHLLTACMSAIKEMNDQKRLSELNERRII